MKNSIGIFLVVMIGEGNRVEKKPVNEDPDPETSSGL